MLKILMSCVFIAVISIQANAQTRTYCHVQGGNVNPIDKIGNTAQITTNGVCNFIPGRVGANLFVEKYEAISKPRNGTVTNGTLSVRYTPKKGFKGNDSFSINFCASSYRGKGCAVVVMNIKVE